MSIGEIGLSTAYMAREHAQENAALTPISKEELEASMMVADAVAFVPRTIEKGIEGACNSTEVSRSICTTVGQFVGNIAKDAANLTWHLLPSSAQNSLEEAARNAKSNQEIAIQWEKEYGIPQEKTLHSLESLKISAESAVTAPIGYGAGTLVARSTHAITKVGSTTLNKVGTTLKRTPKEIGPLPEPLPSLAEEFPKWDFLPDTQGRNIIKADKTYNIVQYALDKDGIMGILVGPPRYIRSSSINYTFKATAEFGVEFLEKIKTLGKKMGAREIQLQFASKADPLFESITNNCHRVQNQFRFFKNEGGRYARDIFPTFLITDKSPLPIKPPLTIKPPVTLAERKISSVPAKMGAMEPFLAEGLRDKTLSNEEPATLIDSAVAVALASIPFTGRVKISQLGITLRSGRKIIVQFLKQDAGGIRMLPPKRFPVSAKEMIRQFEQQGYKVIPGGGKGSHWKLKKPGSPTIHIPNDKELAKGLANKLWKTLETVSTKGAIVAAPVLGQTAQNSSVNATPKQQREYSLLSFEEENKLPEEQILFQKIVINPQEKNSFNDLSVANVEVIFEMERQETPIQESRVEEIVEESEDKEVSNHHQESLINLDNIQASCHVDIDPTHVRDVVLSPTLSFDHQIESAVNISPAHIAQSTVRISVTENTNHPVIQAVNTGLVVNPIAPKQSTVTLMTAAQDTQIGVAITPNRLKNTRVTLAGKVGDVEGSIQVNLRKPLHSQLTAKVPIRIYNLPLIIGVKGCLNKPEDTKLSLEVPTRLLHKVFKPLGVTLPNTIPVASFTPKKVIKAVGKLFGFRRKKKRKHKHTHERALINRPIDQFPIQLQSLSASTTHLQKEVENFRGNVTTLEISTTNRNNGIESFGAKSNDLAVSIRNLSNEVDAFKSNNSLEQVVEGIRQSNQKLQEMNRQLEPILTQINQGSSLIENNRKLEESIQINQQINATLQQNQTMIAQKLRAKISPQDAARILALRNNSK
jgi:predicted RNA binding protein YcfA (HicA-like mRNA interferase family)